MTQRCGWWSSKPHLLYGRADDRERTGTDAPSCGSTSRRHGGPGVVKAAMKTGKKVIAGGPGNPPCVVDETADLAQAGEGIVKGVSLDNNIVCTAEKEIIAVAQIADQLKAEMARFGAYEMNADECARVEPSS